MSEITAEKVAELLEGITQGDDFPEMKECGIVNNDYPLIVAAPDIARAYLAKCEEVEEVIECNSRADGEIDRLEKENQRLQSIIEKQREALGSLRDAIFYGDIDKTHTIIDEALALTQQPKEGEKYECFDCGTEIVNNICAYCSKEREKE